MTFIHHNNNSGRQSFFDFDFKVFHGNLHRYKQQYVIPYVYFPFGDFKLPVAAWRLPYFSVGWNMCVVAMTLWITQNFKVSVFPELGKLIDAFYCKHKICFLEEKFIPQKIQVICGIFRQSHDIYVWQFWNYSEYQETYW